ncbi:MAG: hypothetical protein ACP5NX_03860 [Candidatus Bilamarchaeaceae archaeon]
MKDKGAPVFIGDKYRTVKKRAEDVLERRGFSFLYMSPLVSGGPEQVFSKEEMGGKFLDEIICLKLAGEDVFLMPEGTNITAMYFACDERMIGKVGAITPGLRPAMVKMFYEPFFFRTETRKGVTKSFEQLGFEVFSASLEDSNMETLAVLGEVFRGYPGVSISISINRLIPEMAARMGMSMEDLNNRLDSIIKGEGGSASKEISELVSGLRFGYGRAFSADERYSLRREWDQVKRFLVVPGLEGALSEELGMVEELANSYLSSAVGVPSPPIRFAMAIPKSATMYGSITFEVRRDGYPLALAGGGDYRVQNDVFPSGVYSSGAGFGLIRMAEVLS